MSQLVVPVIQVACKSEWALARFFEALKNPEIMGKFSLETICAREAKEPEIIQMLQNRIQEIDKAILAKAWRADQRKKERENAEYLINLLLEKKVKYGCLRRDNKVPTAAYGEYERLKALVIHSLNITHADYIEDGFLHNAHILCEKPLTTVVNIDGNPDDRALIHLDKIVRACGINLTLMDAEHYSYKKPSIIFYEKVDDLLKGKNGSKLKIIGIEGEIKELDNPEWNRTRDILSFAKNQTGLLGDTMCHLLAFISNLGGRAVAQEREYDSYGGFDADTYDRVSYQIINTDLQKNYFAPNAYANFTVAKFIDKMTDSKEKDDRIRESKFIKFILEDKSEIIINFKDGTVTKDGKDCSYFRHAISGNEYVNVLNEFHEAIHDGRKPRTDYLSSKSTLQTTYETYALPAEKNKRVKIYR